MTYSSLLNELAGIHGSQSYYVDNRFRTQLHDEDLQINLISLDHVFRTIKEHADTCKSCRSLSIAVEYRDRNYRTKDKYFYLNCSCGEEWNWPTHYLSIQYKGMDFEEVIMQINSEIRDGNKDKRDFRQYLEIDYRKYDVPTIHRQAITGLEVTCED